MSNQGGDPRVLTKGTTTEDRPAKYNDLLAIHNMVIDVRNAVSNLFNAVGAVSSPREEKGKPDIAKPCNLVTTIEALPDMIREECNEIHLLIKDTKNSLV